MHRPSFVFNLLALLVFASAFTSTTSAQSTDRDHPTPLKSNELTGDLNTVHKEFFYSFVAGPGELTITIDVKSSSGTTGTYFDLLAKDGATKIICCEFAQADSTGASGRLVKSAQLGTRQMVIMRLEPFGGQGSFRVRLSGPGVPKGEAAANADNVEDSRMGLPASGILRLEMSDGTTQEINLSRVRRVTLKP